MYCNIHCLLLIIKIIIELHGSGFANIFIARVCVCV